MSVAKLNRIIFALFLCAFASIPFELPLAEGIHGVIKPIIGNGYFLFFCGTWTAAISLLYLISAGNSAKRNCNQFSFYGCLFLIPGGLAILTSAWSSNADVQLSIQQFVFGYSAPLLAGLALMNMEYEKQRQA